MCRGPASPVRILGRTAAIFLLLVGPLQAAPHLEPSGPKESTVLGRPPWRDWLLSRGLYPFAFLTLDGVRSLDGGLRESSGALGLLDLGLDIDVAAAGGWAGGLFRLHLQGAGGRQPSAWVGDLQLSDNIEADDSIRVYEAYYQHDLKNWNLLAGRRDYNSDFNLIEAAEVLLHSSFGLQPEINQGLVPTYPVTSWALRAAVDPAREGGGYLLAGIYESVSASALLPGSVRDRRGDGWVSAVEAGYSRLDAGPHTPRLKAALGVWYLDRERTAPDGSRRDGNRGLYAIFEASRPLPDRPHGRWVAFGQLGAAPEDRNLVSSYIGAGARVHGWAASRPADDLALAVARALFSDEAPRDEPGAAGTETAVELTWRAGLRPGLAVQPDLQYIRHPGGRRDVEDAWVMTLRLRLDF